MFASKRFKAERIDKEGLCLKTTEEKRTNASEEMMKQMTLLFVDKKLQKI